MCIEVSCAIEADKESRMEAEGSNNRQVDDSALVYKRFGWCCSPPMVNQGN